MALRAIHRATRSARFRSSRAKCRRSLGDTVRILLVAGKLTYSNKAVYTLELVRGLVERGHEVHVAALGGPLFPRLTELGAAEAYVVKFNYFSFRRLLAFLRDFEPEIIHDTGGARALETAIRVARALGTPLIHTLHSWLKEDRRQALPTNLRGIIAVNEDLRQHLVNELNVPKKRIRVIPYGVDCKAVVPREEERSPDRVRVVGTFGRLEQGRRYDEFLAAARAVVDSGQEVHFMIAGEGPDEDRLRKLTKKLKLNEAVTFVQPGRDASPIYRVVDVLVVVSDWGGVALTLLEGMAHGLPVIATGGGEVFPFVAEENVCVIVPPGEPERLADEIVHLVRDPERARELGQNARACVLRNYPHAEQVERVVEYYNHVLTSSG